MEEYKIMGEMEKENGPLQKRSREWARGLERRRGRSDGDGHVGGDIGAGEG